MFRVAGSGLGRAFAAADVKRRTGKE